MTSNEMSNKREDMQNGKVFETYNCDILALFLILYGRWESVVFWHRVKFLRGR